VNNKIKHLLEKSREVIHDCHLENGAIIAANTDKDYFPKSGNNYRYVWPRDAAFCLYAAKLLGIEIQKSFVNWLLTRAENFRKTGMIYQRYATNGARDFKSGSQYQPDQAGSLLWVLTETNKNLDPGTAKAISLLAKGLCKSWSGKHFSIETHDLWEERHSLPHLEGNFIYTLAACSFGLYKAYRKLGNKKWLKVSNEMKRACKITGESYYPRLWGKIPDKRIDASVLGLAWPFEIDSLDKKLMNSVRLVEKKLLTSQGVHRYEHDEYDGEIEGLTHRKKGAGGWPLLTFWYIIVLSRLGRKKAATKLFNIYVKQFKEYIPEQVFDNKIQVSILPLNWSHSMFVIAANELNYLRE
jgi:GH15 family glucan-1,4-alpha-glucosidase